MKKLIVGLVAVGAVIVLRPVVKRRMVQQMREHCEQMMGQFAGRRATTGDEAVAAEPVRQQARGPRGVGPVAC